MTTLMIEGRKVKVSDDFLSLPAEEQERTVEEIAEQMGLTAEPEGGVGNRVMSQFNRGVADAIDFLNPFDEPHALNPFEGGASAADGFRAVGISTAEGEPENAWQAAQRGTGAAAASAFPIAKGLQLAGRGTGLAARVSDDAFRSMATTGGAVSEVAAGGISAGAERAAEDAGAPDWVQQVTAIAAPVGALGALSGGRYLAERAPGARAARGLYRGAKGTLAPYTKAGATEVARRQVQNLAGGTERAFQIGERITGDNPLNLTPAQQTGDPNMLGLESLAARQDPNIADDLAAREMAAEDATRGAMREGAGDVEDARLIFERQRTEFAETLQGMVNDRLQRAGAAADALDPRRESAQNSARATEAVEGALQDAEALERRLWLEVEQVGGAAIRPTAARAEAERIVESTVWAQADDIPAKVRRFLDMTADGQTQTVGELHGLYSDLRRVARAAMAGADQNKNRARLANAMADAILRDLGAHDPTDPVGQAINSAREYSRALHETFDRGAAGRILKRTLDGDTTIDPRLALDREVGPGGTRGDVGAEQVIQAAEFVGQGTAQPFVEDYLRGMVARAMRDETGAFNERAAARFARDNQPLLRRFPGLREDMREAVSANEDAAAFAKRVEARLARLSSTSSSTVARFIDGPPEKAIKAVTQARVPARAAAKLVAAAKKDPSGEALAGLKDAFSAELIGGAADGAALLNRLESPRFRAALAQIYTKAELSRMRRLASDLAQMQSSAANAANVGESLSGAQAPRLVRVLARIIAANNATGLSNNSAGASLQTAQIASGAANDLVNRLTADRASRLIADAITDPELFRTLLMDPSSKQFAREAESLLLPYLIGAGAASTVQE